MRNAVSRALREVATVTQPGRAGHRRCGADGQLRQGGRVAPARAVHRAPQPQAVSRGERDGAEGARRSRQRRPRAARRSRPSSRSVWRATSSSSTPPASGSSSTTTPRSATSSPCCGHSRSAAFGCTTGTNRREWQIFLSLLLSLSERGEPDERLEELHERLGCGQGHGPRDRARVYPGGHELEPSRPTAGPKRVYAQGVAVTKDVITGVRLGRATSAQAGEARGAAGRRPGAQQRDLDGRA